MATELPETGQYPGQRLPATVQNMFRAKLVRRARFLFLIDREFHRRGRNPLALRVHSRCLDYISARVP